MNIQMNNLLNKPFIHVYIKTCSSLSRKKTEEHRPRTTVPIGFLYRSTAVLESGIARKENMYPTRILEGAPYGTKINRILPMEQQKSICCKNSALSWKIA